MKKNPEQLVLLNNILIKTEYEFLKKVASLISSTPPPIKTLKDEEIEATLFHSDSSISKKKREDLYQSLLEYIYEEEFLIESAIQKALEEEIEYELRIRDELERTQLRERQIIADFNNQKTYAMTLEGLQFERDKLIALIGEMEKLHAALDLQIRALTSEISNEYKGMLHKFFDEINFSAQHPELAYLDEIIKESNDEFKNISSLVNDNLIRDFEFNGERINKYIQDQVYAYLDKQIEIKYKDKDKPDNFAMDLQTYRQLLETKLIDNFERVNSKTDRVRMLNEKYNQETVLLNFLSKQLDNVDLLRESIEKRSVNLSKIGEHRSVDNNMVDFIKHHNVHCKSLLANINNVHPNMDAPPVYVKDPNLDPANAHAQRRPSINSKSDPPPAYVKNPDSDPANAHAKINNSTPKNNKSTTYELNFKDRFKLAKQINKATQSNQQAVAPSAPPKSQEQKLKYKERFIQEKNKATPAKEGNGNGAAPAPNESSKVYVMSYRDKVKAMQNKSNKPANDRKFESDQENVDPQRNHFKRR